MRFFTKLVLCGVTGLFLSLSFPKADLWFLAWVAYVPLLLVLMREEHLKKAAACGFFTHVLFYVLLLYWVPSVPHIGSMGMPGLLVLALVSSIYPAVFCAGFWIVCKKLLTGKVSFLKLLHCALFSSFFFVACDYVRSLGFFGFTWGALGYSQYKNLPVIQIAEWTGYHGVTFLVMFVNTFSLLFFHAVLNCNKIERINFIIGMLIVLVCILTGISIAGGKFSSARPPVPVAIIQGNTVRDTNWTTTYREVVWNEYEKLSREAMKHNPKPKLLVYPERIIALGDLNEAYYALRFSRIAKELNAVLATGLSDSLGDEKLYNTAAVFSNQGALLGKYYKTKLVPFGEKVPLKNLFLHFGYNPWGDWNDDSVGETYNPIETPIGKLGFNICYETTYAHVSRILVKNGAQILVGVIADSWYKKVETYQHTAMFVFRAVENRRYAIRASDSGISCIITPEGKILNPTKPFTQAIVYGNVSMNSALTFYTRYGDVFVALCVIYCAASAAFLLAQKRTI